MRIVACIQMMDNWKCYFAVACNYYLEQSDMALQINIDVSIYIRME